MYLDIHQGGRLRDVRLDAPELTGDHFRTHTWDICTLLKSRFTEDHATGRKPVDSHPLATTPRDGFIPSAPRCILHL